MPINFSVFNGDITEVVADVVVLKLADRLRGADRAVAHRFDWKDTLKIDKGSHCFFDSHGRIGAKEILFLGVGSLTSFEYLEIEEFGRVALEVVASERPDTRRVAITIHGPGYGLDELASTDRLVRGLISASKLLAGRTIEIILAERSSSRVKFLKEFLYESDLIRSELPPGLNPRLAPKVARSISDHGTYSRRLFASLPFNSDTWTTGN